MKITVKEVLGKEKSTVITTTEGKKFYALKDVPQMCIGQSYEVEYEGKPYRPPKGDSITLNWIKSVKDVSVSPEPPKEEVKEPTDWTAKERRELRKTIWDSVFMTVYKENQGMADEIICEKVLKFANAGVAFTWTEDKDIEM